MLLIVVRRVWHPVEESPANNPSASAKPRSGGSEAGIACVVVAVGGGGVWCMNRSRWPARHPGGGGRGSDGPAQVRHAGGRGGGGVVQVVDRHRRRRRDRPAH